MEQRRLHLLAWLLLALKTATSEAATENYYKAAVVEYNPSTNSIQDYLEIIEGIEKVDIIVFPEATLGGNYTKVPNGAAKAVPCGSTEDYEDYLKQLSCAAKSHNSYLVVNLKEKEVCTSETQALVGDKRLCSSTGYNLYNTDVAFDRTGAIVARYRKYNLFGEFGLNTTVTPDISTFTTDFDVTFGLFTCFDILFETPALALTRMNITNIVFPTMWFSELPFLTALQAQQMFSVTTGVNFLSSGANSPARGSGGTGIFQGVNGPRVFDYVEEGGTKVYVAEVGKTPDLLPEENGVGGYAVDVEDVDRHAKAMDGFTLIRDNVDVYTTVPINTSVSNTQQTLCHEDFCCAFNVSLTAAEPSTTNYYSYRLVAYSGVRSFSGVYNGGIEVCGLISCLNSSLESCGYRFPNYTTVSWPVGFEQIEITANFTDVHTRQQYPTSLLSNIRPVFPNATTWSTVEYDGVVERRFTLDVAQSRLMTFAIYGRDFERDSDPFAVTDGAKTAGVCYGLVVGIAVLMVGWWGDFGV